MIPPEPVRTDCRARVPAYPFTGELPQPRNQKYFLGAYKMTLQDIISRIEPLDHDFLTKALEHTLQLAIPPHALGRLHEISEKLCAIRQTLTPSVSKKAFLVMAGDHGVAAEGVSAFPQQVTGEMVKNFIAGGASINALAREQGAEVWVVDLGIIPDLPPEEVKGQYRFIIEKVARGTANLAQGPAMTLEQAEESIVKGYNLAREAFDQGVELLGTGDMGIANTTPSTAIAAVLLDQPSSVQVGPGTGLDDKGVGHKKRIIQQALKVNRPDPRNGLDVLTKVGGFEIGGIAGCVLAGAAHRRPVVIDGLISTAGALIAHSLCPTVSDYLFAGHCSQEPAHRAMMEHLGLTPILDLGLRLGEGTGGALAMGIISSAARMFKEVLTFEQAGVTSGD